MAAGGKKEKNRDLGKKKERGRKLHKSGLKGLLNYRNLQYIPLKNSVSDTHTFWPLNLARILSNPMIINHKKIIS